MGRAYCSSTNRISSASRWADVFGRRERVVELLGRDFLFYTDFGRARWEPLARANLNVELTALADSVR